MVQSLKKRGKITAKTIDFFLFQCYTIFNKRGPVFARKTYFTISFKSKTTGFYWPLDFCS